jgi:hypothetical protein
MNQFRQTISGEMPSFLTSTVPVPSYSTRSRSLPVGAGSPAPSGRRGSALASAIGLRKKNEIDIVLDDPRDSARTYSTFDEIKGRVDIKFEKDTPFHDLTITFEGQSFTYVERVATTAPTTGRTTGRHTFLKVQQPIPEGVLSDDSIFHAGITYSIPFTFVVPDRLLPFICSHRVQDEDIRHEHLQLPPSLGDPSTSGMGNTPMDDLAPEMAKISYSIRARVTRWNSAGRIVEVADKSERVRVVPARDEAPLLRGDCDSEAEHVLRKEKNVKRGLFKIGKTGRLTAETSQPRSLRLPHPRNKRQGEPVASMATVNLRFDPQAAEDVPPQLDSIVSKLKVRTFFGAAPYTVLPEVRKHDSWSPLHGVYPETVSLSSRNLSTVSWTRHDPSSLEEGQRGGSISSSSELSRRPSGYSTSSTSSSPAVPDPSCQYQSGSPFYTATVLVPIALPTSSSEGGITAGISRPKIFVPTFHTCMISRSYAVELNLSFRTPAANVSSSHVVLKTPIQISAEGGVPPAHMQEPDAAIVAEVERQFGMYEGDGDSFDLGVSSPVYQETNPHEPLLSGGTRHLSLADTSAAGMDYQTPPPLLPYSGIDATSAGTSPPEYRVGSGFNTYGARDRPGGPRTQSVSLFAFA